MSDNTNEVMQRCEPCALDGDDENVEGFCVKCIEYLCKGCVKDHRKNKATRAHRVLLGDELPSDCSVFKRMNKLMLCFEHPELTIEYECGTHEQFICSKCLAISHRKCDKIVDISSIPPQEAANKQLVAMLAEIHGNISTLKVSNESGRKYMCQQQERIEIETKKFVENILSTLKVQSEKVNSDAKQIVQREVFAINEDKDKFQVIEKEVKSNEELLGAVKKYGDNEEMKVIQVLLRGRLEKWQSDIATLSTRKEVKLEFRGNQTFGTITDLGKIISTQKDRCLVDLFGRRGDELSSDEIRCISLTNDIEQCPSKYPIQAQTDKHVCCVVASVVLLNGCLIAIDKNNKKIKAFWSNYGMASESALTETPIDMCLVNMNSVAVIFENIKVVKCFQVADSINRKHVFATDSYCLKISKFDGEMNILILTSSKIHGQGKMQFQVRHAHTGQCIRYIDVTNHNVCEGEISRIRYNKNNLFVTKKSKVHCYTVYSNNLIEKWFHQLDIEDASDICTDDNGLIYISGKKSNRIVKFTDRRGYEHVTLVSDVPAPTCLTVDDRNRRLIVWCENNNFVHVYRYK